jgi:hypothetical protein
LLSGFSAISRKIVIYAFVLALAVARFFDCTPIKAEQTTATANVVLPGEVLSSQNQAYIAFPCTLPVGALRTILSLYNVGHDRHTVFDLGIVDGFWS